MNKEVNSRGEASNRSPFTNEPYGFCAVCEMPLQVSEWFSEKEYDSNGIPTGRVRYSAASLVCPNCLTSISIDDTFDSPYFSKK